MQSAFQTEEEVIKKANDTVSSVPPATQSKLLTVVQEFGLYATVYVRPRSAGRMLNFIDIPRTLIEPYDLPKLSRVEGM